MTALDDLLAAARARLDRPTGGVGRAALAATHGEPAVAALEAWLTGLSSADRAAIAATLGEAPDPTALARVADELLADAPDAVSELLYDLDRAL
jgi:hypothetical protein